MKRNKKFGVQVSGATVFFALGCLFTAGYYGVGLTGLLLISLFALPFAVGRDVLVAYKNTGRIGLNIYGAVNLLPIVVIPAIFYFIPDSTVIIVFIMVAIVFIAMIIRSGTEVSSRQK